MLEILYEDSDVAVVNKPAGIAVHPSAHNLEERTLVSELVARWPEIKKVGDEPSLRPGIVHRLDKETSGVLLVAKNQKAFLYLKKQFQEHLVAKTYTALVVGKMPEKEGKIALSLARSRKFGKFTTKIPRLPVGKTGGKIREAVTRWRVLHEYKKEGSYLSLLEVVPETGRTHQIRVHLAAIGHPVVGDPLYGGKASKRYRDVLGRHFLHAKSLSLTLPSGTRLQAEAEMPGELTKFLEMFAKT